MKFILKENTSNKIKYILKEHFILKEDSILTEASAESVAKKYTELFKATLDNSEKVLNTYITYADISKKKKELDEVGKKLVNAEKEIKTTLILPTTEISKEIDGIKSEIKVYLDVLNLVLKTITKTEQNEDTLILLQNKLNTLPKFEDNQEWTNADTEILRKLSTWVDTNVLPLCDPAETEALAKTVQEFKEECKNCIELIKRISEALPEFFTEFEEADIRNYIETIQAATEATKLKDASTINKGLIVANIAVYKKQVLTLKDNYNSILTSAVVSAEEEAKEAKIDWTEKYNSAVDKKTVFGEYLATVWSDHLDSLKSIEDTFREECEEYGFTDNNPFISFIKKVYLPYKIKPDLYLTIHEAVENGYISSNALSGNGDLGDTDVIFCEDLYNKDSKTLLMYIKKQKKLLTVKAKEGIFDSVDEEDKVKVLITNVFYNPITAPKKYTDIKAAKLNSLNKIETLEIYYTGKSTNIANKKEKKKVTDLDLELQTQAAAILCVDNMLNVDTLKLDNSIITVIKELNNKDREGYTKARLDILKKLGIKSLPTTEEGAEKLVLDIDKRIKENAEKDKKAEK